MNVLDLFSGIGGFSLGLERAGMRTVAFCESDENCRRILQRHWPNVPIYRNALRLTAEQLWTDGIDADSIRIICGGFPCQDISEANSGGLGIAGKRSGLWSEFARLVDEIRPEYALVENVSALLRRDLGTVLRDMAAIGYDAEWHSIPAAAIGAPHIRDRIWVIAYPSEGQRRPLDLACNGVAWRDALSQRQESSGGPPRLFETAWGDDPILVADALSRMDDGIRIRLDGFNASANAVVPQIPEIIGRAIMSSFNIQEGHGK